MFSTSAFVRSRPGLLRKVGSAGMGAVLVLAGLAGSTGGAQARTRPASVTQADDTTLVDHVTVQGRTVKLWRHEDDIYFHAQIVNGGQGDVVKLEWSNNGFKTYEFWGATIQPGQSSANTKDEPVQGSGWWFRACGFVGSHTNCTHDA